MQHLSTCKVILLTVNQQTTASILRCSCTQCVSEVTVLKILKSFAKSTQRISNDTIGTSLIKKIGTNRWLD